MLSVDNTLFIQIVNFLVLLLLLNIFLFKPIRGILAKRNQEEGTLKGFIDDYQARAEQSGKGVEEGKIRARKEGVSEKDSIKEQGLEKEQNIVQEAFSAAEEKIEVARKDMDAKIADVRKSLEDQVAAFSNELTEKILGRSV